LSGALYSSGLLSYLKQNTCPHRGAWGALLCPSRAKCSKQMSKFNSGLEGFHNPLHDWGGHSESGSQAYNRIGYVHGTAFQLANNAASNKGDVAAASLKRDAARDKNPSFHSKKSTQPDDTICEESITRITSKGVRCRPTVYMTCDVSIYSGQYIVQQHQVHTSVDSTGKSNVQDRRERLGWSLQ
jgi:hypothetical protein